MVVVNVATQNQKLKAVNETFFTYYHLLFPSYRAMPRNGNRYDPKDNYYRYNPTATLLH